jgi:Tol biopolymer transport system component
MKTLQARVWTFPLFFLVAAGCAEGGSADDVVVSEGAPNMFPQGTPLDVSPPALGTRMREHAILPPSVSRPMFVAARLRGRPSYDLYTMWDDGSGLRHLTNTPNVDELVPSVSPDGHHLAYVRGGRLWVMNTDGTWPHQVADDVSMDPPTPAAWSPTGEWLAYASAEEDGGARLRKVRWDGSGDASLPVMQSEPGLRLSEPVWAPDGDIACFGASTLADARPIGGLFTTSTRAPWRDQLVGRRAHGLDIARREGRWVFTATDDATPAGYNAYGALIVAFGTAPTDGWVVRGGGARAPRWSPDGSEIAYVGREGVFVMSADGARERGVLASTDVSGFDW